MTEEQEALEEAVADCLKDRAMRWLKVLDHSVNVSVRDSLSVTFPVRDPDVVTVELLMTGSTRIEAYSFHPVKDGTREKAAMLIEHMSRKVAAKVLGS